MVVVGFKRHERTKIEHLVLLLHTLFKIFNEVDVQICKLCIWIIKGPHPVCGHLWKCCHRCVNTLDSRFDIVTEMSTNLVGITCGRTTRTVCIVLAQ